MRWFCPAPCLKLLSEPHGSGFGRPVLVRTFATNKSEKTFPPNRSSRVLLDQALAPFVPRSAHELANVLAENVLYHSVGDVLVVDKPYGVGCLGYQQKGYGVFSAYRYKEREDLFDEKKKDDAVTLEDAIPLLKGMFNEPELQFCTGIKRWTSGPVVLPCSSKANKRIIRSIYQGGGISHSMEDRPAQHMHRALFPRNPRMLYKMAVAVFHQAEVTTNTSLNTGHATEYIFVPSAKAKKRARRGKFAVQGECSYEVLASRYGLSLVDIHFSKFSRHFPRLVLSHLGAPVLGDPIYERRLLVVDGRATVSEPKDAWRGERYEPAEFLSRVGVERLGELRPKPPMFLAVYQSTFPFYGDTKGQRRNTKFVARTRPPEHFMAMAELLNFAPTIEQMLRSLELEEVEEEIAESSSENRADGKNVVGGDTKF